MILTVGHSNHPIDMFLSLLDGAGVTAIADVRSAPWSRRWPQYRKQELKEALTAAGIAYVWLGDALGGKPKHETLWSDGRPDPKKIAASPGFAAAIGRLAAGMAEYRIALMCAERDPAQCHRTHLVTPALTARGIAVGHILQDGTLLPDEELRRRLTKKDPAEDIAPDLFGK